MFVIGCDSFLLREQLDNVVAIDKSLKIDPSIKVIYCEDDGSSIVLYNTGLTIEDLHFLKETVHTL